MNRQDPGFGWAPVGAQGHGRGRGHRWGAGGVLAACSFGDQGLGWPVHERARSRLASSPPLTGPPGRLRPPATSLCSARSRRPARTRAGSRSAARTTRSTSSSRTASRTPTGPPRWPGSSFLEKKVDMVLTHLDAGDHQPLLRRACEKLGTAVPVHLWCPGSRGTAAWGGNPGKPTNHVQVLHGVLLRAQAVPRAASCRCGSGSTTTRWWPASIPTTADGSAVPRGVRAADQVVRVQRSWTAAPTQDGTTDYSSMISKFKSKHCELYSNAPLAAGLQHVLEAGRTAGLQAQAGHGGPRCCCSPADTAALGSLVNNVATDSWWSPYVPYKSLARRPERQGPRRTRSPRPTGQAVGCSRSAPATRCS